MGDIPQSPSSFRSALSFFNSLDRPKDRPLIPKKTFEVKLVIDGIPKQLIPRARLIGKQDDTNKTIIRNIPAQDYQKPQIPPSNQGPLTPDMEAKQILEAFNKEINSFNFFEIPLDALESDFLKQTLSLANSDLSEKVSPRNSYGIPDRIIERKQVRSRTRHHTDGNARIEGQQHSLRYLPPKNAEDKPLCFKCEKYGYISKYCSQNQPSTSSEAPQTNHSNSGFGEGKIKPLGIARNVDIGLDQAHARTDIYVVSDNVLDNMPFSIGQQQEHIVII
ncbi:unnamed protein product [Ceutorhynchus assimilis]|uniref:Uncharacterized protein n=1 Tax=Ceutorhynchus assimilis TaxID=467358 RepID=A0A9N9MQI1_9CUCU|nr:unnamed protein product [Ceutorhynchus assimilis]